MKHTWIISLTSLLFILTACAPEAEIGHIEEETEIFLFSEGGDASISLNALMNNQSERPSDELILHLEVNDEEARDLFSEPELLTESEDETFAIGGGERFMVSETYLLDEAPEDPETLSGVIDGVIINEDGEEVYRFTFDQVEEA
ncbi:hypothetical protein HUG15_16005 [Salicibibacter cibarius]|uniref:Type 1 periplasmic binding fold superfamily protein n=1 Tax=Salicibibacter cibarius TaxID=2743000 RepID=A0A7T7CCI1_9BACI|nr:hypothetical protein [Salicibibacter cibarius]QQK76924.1 hypothetical protein HUG15_16005 [Salicibibacter cibarius]